MSEEERNNTNKVKKKLSISDIKNQVVCMLDAISELNSKEQTEAYDYLQKCITNLDVEESTPTSDSGCVEVEDCSSISNDSGYLDNNKGTILNTETKAEDSINKLENKFDCSICGLTFLTANTLYKHSSQHKKYTISCRKCKKSFSSFDIYEIHKQLKVCSKVSQTCNKSLTCTICNREFVNPQHYSLHMKGHERNKCNVCGAEVNSRKLLQKHMMELHNLQPEKILFKCLFCEMKFAQKRTLLKHYKTVHKEESALVCLVCGLAFNSKDNLDEHSKKHTLNSFKCELCDATFSRKQQYLVHIKDHNKYLCVTCGKSYPNLKLMEPHEQDGHIICGLVMQYNCSECDKSFHFHSSLFYHMKSHANEKTHFCRECSCVFKSKADFKQHVSSVNAHVKDIIPTKVLECSYCGKTFTVKRKFHCHQFKCKKKLTTVISCDVCDYKTSFADKMKDHKSTHSETKRFVCEKCGSFFSTRNQLTEHFNYIHSDERNFSCEKCGQTFKSANVLNRHMLCHSTERNHHCHCGQQYKFKSNLRRHEMLAHGCATSKRMKQLMNDDTSIYKSVPKKKRKKKNEKENLNEDVSESVYNLLNSESLSLPLTSQHHDAIMLPSEQPDNQMLQVSYPSMSYVPENKTHLVYSQSLDMENLHVVETMLQTEESLKNSSGVLVDSTHSDMFDRQLSDHDATGYHLPSDGLIHPPIEPSLVTSLEEPLHPSATDHLVSNATSQQSLMSALPDYLPHNFSFLNM